MKSVVYKLIVAAVMTILMVACENGNKNVFYFKDGEFYVWDNSVSMFVADYNAPFEKLEDGVFIVGHHYTIEVPNHNPANYSTWIKNNAALIDNMEQQWKRSSYYDANHPTKLEFTQIENIHITADQTLWGRDKGEDLSDMFLIKAQGPYFSFPEGNMLPDEEIDSWMTIEKWCAKNAVASSYRLKPKAPTECGDTFILFLKERVRDSWNSKTITRRGVYSFQKRNGSYSFDFSWWGEEEIAYEEEWMQQDI